MSNQEGMETKGCIGMKYPHIVHLTKIYIYANFQFR